MSRKHKRLRPVGRASKDRFVMLDYWLLECAAWDRLSLGARCLYIEVRRRFNGINNGQISFSVREAAEKLHVAKDTAAKWFHELENKGFLKARQRGSFDYKKRHATEWVITAERYMDEPATKEYMRWRPEKQNPVPMSGTIGHNQRDRAAQMNRSNGPLGHTEKDREASNRVPDGPTQRDTSNIPGRGSTLKQPVGVAGSNATELATLPAFLDRRHKAS